MFKYIKAYVATVIFLLACTQLQANGLDPTRPLFGDKKDASRVMDNDEVLTLQSIIRSQGRSKAIISGKLLTVGEQIGEFKLSKINDKSVVLRSESDQVTLKIFSNVATKSK